MCSKKCKICVSVHYLIRYSKAKIKYTVYHNKIKMLVVFLVSLISRKIQKVGFRLDSLAYDL